MPTSILEGERGEGGRGREAERERGEEGRGGEGGRKGTYVCSFNLPDHVCKFQSDNRVI